MAAVDRFRWGVESWGQVVTYCFHHPRERGARRGFCSGLVVQECAGSTPLPNSGSLCFIVDNGQAGEDDLLADVPALTQRPLSPTKTITLF